MHAGLALQYGQSHAPGTKPGALVSTFSGGLDVSKQIFKQFVALSLVGAMAAASPSIHAQSTTATAPEEIIVTARKREEALMEVPVAISVLTARDLEVRGIENLQDVALFTPGLAYFDAIQNQLGTPVVRGISQTNLNSPDRNVAIFYGGVYLANSNAANLDLMDVERVEVVKGPQSALYGRNAFMGAINYVPATPTEDFMAFAESTLGSDERQEFRLKVSGPITDTLGGRIAGSRSTFDGTWDNSADRDDNLGGYEVTTLSGMLDWKPGDFSASLFGYYTDDRRDSTAQYYVPLNCGPTPAVNTVYCGDFPVQKDIAALPEALAFSREVTLGAVDMDYDFGSMTLGGQLAYYNAKTDNYSDYQTGAHDGAGSVFDIVNAANPTTVLRQQAVPYYVGNGQGDSDSWSAELRLESAQDQRLRWMVGTFYFENEATSYSRVVFDGRSLAQGEYPRDAFGLGALSTRYEDPRDNMATLAKDKRKDEQFAYFGSIDLDVTEDLTVGAELRHDDEDRRRQSLLIGPSSLQKGSFDYDTWRFSADYTVAESHLIYASAAKGVISGYFNPTFDSVAQIPVPAEFQNYDPAENITYELGWKAFWLDNRMTTELTVFYIDYTDIQINANAPPETGLISNVIQNIGDASGKGFELAVNYAPNDSWTMGITYSYAPTEFDSGTPDPGMSRYCGGNAGLLAGFCPSVTFNGRLQPDVGGENLPRSPETLASGYLQYTMPFAGDWTLSARTDVSYTDEIPQYSLPFAYWKDRTLVNARISAKRGPLEIALWARNLFDEKYVSAGINQPPIVPPLSFLPNVTLGERLTWGLTGSYSFGGN